MSDRSIQNLPSVTSRWSDVTFEKHLLLVLTFCRIMVLPAINGAQFSHIIIGLYKEVKLKSTL
jgi:hypothetical protein